MEQTLSVSDTYSTARLPSMKKDWEKTPPLMQSSLRKRGSFQFVMTGNPL